MLKMFSTLTMDEAYSFETLVGFQRFPQRYILEDTNIYKVYFKTS